MLWMEGQKKKIKPNFLSTLYHCFHWTQVDKVLENHPVALQWRQGYNLDKLPNTTTDKQIRVGSLRNVNVFGLWEVAGEPGELPGCALAQTIYDKSNNLQSFGTLQVKRSDSLSANHMTETMCMEMSWRQRAEVQSEPQNGRGRAVGNQRNHPVRSRLS